MADIVLHPIRLLDRGPRVRDLHEALTNYGQDIDNRERTESRFGLSTRDALIAFQSANQLPPTGIVDAATAETLTVVLARRAPDPAPEPQPRRRFGLPNIGLGRLRATTIEAATTRAAAAVPRLRISARALRRANRVVYDSPDTTTDDAAAMIDTAAKKILRDQLAAALRDPSKKLRDAVAAVEINLDDVEDLPFNELLRDRVLPEIIADPDIAQELETNFR